MSAMRPELMQGRWIEVETTGGTEWIPESVVTPLTDVSELEPYCEGRPLRYEVREGFGARTTMPGYMDATDWTVYDTEAEAWRGLLEHHADSFTWIWEPGHGYHRYCESEACAEALVEAVQSIDGQRVERDGTCVYTTSDNGEPSDDLADFTVVER